MHESNVLLRARFSVHRCEDTQLAYDQISVASHHHILETLNSFD